MSEDSVDKDKRQLPRLYAQAGVPELWLVDARGSDFQFQNAGERAPPYNHPRCRAIRAASTRFSAPSLLIASER